MIRKFIAAFVMMFLVMSSTAFAADESKVIQVVGEGIAKAKYKNQPGLYHICAYRVARMDAFSKIMEYKFVEESSSPDKLKSSEDAVKTSMSGVIKGALQIGEPQFFDDGTCKVTMELIKIKPGSVIRVTGSGIGPTNLDKQDSFYKTYARQAARMDALRNLSETITGIEISSESTFSDQVLGEWKLKTKVVHDQKSFKLIKESARQVGETKFYDNGVCEVTVELIIPADWKE